MEKETYSRRFLTEGYEDRIKICIEYPNADKGFISIGDTLEIHNKEYSCVGAISYPVDEDKKKCLIAYSFRSDIKEEILTEEKQQELNDFIKTSKRE